MAYLQNHMRKRQRPARPALRLVMAMAAVVVLALSGIFSVRLYAAPSAYVDLDVNPSIELTLNRFGRVLEAQAYNDDGTALLQDLKLRHLSCERATRELLAAMIDQGYLTDGLVSVTVQGGAEQVLAASLQNIVGVILSEHHAIAEVEVSVVSPEVKDHARDCHMSPARYLAIRELQEDDPAVTFESCAGESLGELRERHGAGHHGAPQEDAENSAPPQSQNGQNGHDGGGQHHGQGHNRE